MLASCGRAPPPPPAEPAPVVVDTSPPQIAEDVAPPPTRTIGKYGARFDPPGSHGLIVYMHGMGASPEDSCRYFEPAAIATRATLICPRGNARQSQGGAWIGNLEDKRYSLDQMMAVRPSRGTLMGFSIGARFAMQLAMAEPGKWRGLILMNQKMDVPLADLQRAGVERVVLCAGQYDASYPVLHAEKQKLVKAGYPARFVDFGPVGHHFAAQDMEGKMVEAITWVRGAEP